MGTTIFARDYLGNVLSKGTLDMSPLIASARAAGSLLLGGVDEYDDTVFNGLQTKLLLEEFDSIQANGVDAELAELRAMSEIVMDRGHRYLVFNGD